jgi:hypothetical protein
MPKHHISMKSLDEEFKHYRRWLQDLMTPGFLHQTAAPQIYTTCLDFLQVWEEKARLSKKHPFVAAVLDAVSRSSLSVSCVSWVWQVTDYFKVWAITFGADPSNSTTKVGLRMYSSMKSLALPMNIHAEDLIPEAPWLSPMMSITTLADSLETSVQSPFPVLAHWFLRQMPAMRRAHAVRDNLIEKEVAKTLTRLRRRAERDGDVRCALDEMIRREMMLSEKEGRAPIFHSRAMYDEVWDIGTSVFNNVES